MPMFITFYSFKGGVGRTLALANVATLLSKDKTEPCRVLVWDFDLSAPGLQNVTQCKWRNKKVGFVDYVHTYIRDAKIETIADYIYETSNPRVDILPAGFMGPDYARKLEDIQWQEIYEEARGFQFIANTKAQISQLSASYDYVLIDSLTGYSDVGGICVNQLADSVVLIFRLNNQNLEGISKVLRSITDSARGRGLGSQTAGVVPVISPAWPFAASETNEWYDRAKGVFGGQRIFTLSFEGSMMLGEKILCASGENYKIEPPILRDYRELTQHLRSLNPQDLQTTFRLAKKLQEQDQFANAIELFGSLARRHPETERYWRELTSTIQMTPKGSHKKVLTPINELISRSCEAGKPWAYVAKAWLAETIDEDWPAASAEFDKAIELAPRDPQLYFSRALSRLNHDQYAEAASDFQRALEFRLRAPRLGYALADLGYCCRMLGQLESALKYYTLALKKRPNDTGLLSSSALTLYSMGRYTDAEEELSKAAKIDPLRNSVKTLSAHVLAALGKRDESKIKLNEARQQAEANSQWLLPVAETYLVVEPAETLSLLDAYPDLVKEATNITSFLRAFAAILLDLDPAVTENVLALGKSGSSLKKENWDVTELREFLKWGEARKLLTEDQTVKITKLLADVPWTEAWSDDILRLRASE